MKRKLPALILAGLLCLALTVAAFAAVEEVVTLRIDDVTAYSQEDGVYTVREDGLYGFYRADGTQLLEPNYAAAGEFHNGMAAVSLAGEWVRVREDGRMVTRFQGGRFGYVNTDGILMISMQYAQAFPFSEDRAFVVKSSGELTLVDKTGEELAVFPNAALPEGESIQFSEGLAVIPAQGGEDQPETVYLVVDLSGKEICTLTDAYVDYANGYHDGRIVVAGEGQWELDEAGEPVRFVLTPGTWGYRDEQGELAMEEQFEEAEAFRCGMAPVRVKGENGKTGCGLISPTGEMLVPAEYDGAVVFEDGSCALLSEDKWAYADQDGQFITGFDFDEVRPFHEGTAFARVGKELRAVSETGSILFSVEAAQALDFSGGAAALQRGDGTCGVCDSNGELLVPFEYESAYHWDGYLWLKRGDIWRVYETAEVIAAREDAPEGEPAEVGGFLDVPADSWYADAVTWATDHDIITGTGGGQFSPDRSCTTGEILTFFWRAIGRPEPEVDNPFSDVSASNYYYEAALWAYENGMVDGETFGAAQLCSRAMAVSYLWRLAGCPEDHTAAFADVSEDAEYAYAVAWAVAEGITDGSGDGLFSPDTICSRGQIVTFLYRYLAN